MGRGGSIAFKRMRGSEVCPWGLAQQWGRLPVPLFVLFSLLRIAYQYQSLGRWEVVQQLGHRELTAEVLIVIVGARGRRGG